VQVPAWLARSSVYKRVPAGVRWRLDQVILTRPEDCATLEAIAERFDLQSRFGVSDQTLRSYASRLEAYARPVVASQLMAAVLGCLPEGYRRQLMAGNQVLLLSRVANALTAEESVALTVPDLARLTSALSALAGRMTPASRGRPESTRKASTAEQAAPAVGPAEAPAQLAEAVRMIYGLSWPIQDTPKDADSSV
jgi:hypothetical protein